MFIDGNKEENANSSAICLDGPETAGITISQNSKGQTCLFVLSGCFYTLSTVKLNECTEQVFCSVSFFSLKKSQSPWLLWKHCEAMLLNTA